MTYKTDLAAVQAALRPGTTRLVWVETPANPTWELTDLSAVAELAHAAGARVAVDSTRRRRCIRVRSSMASIS